MDTQDTPQPQDQPKKCQVVIEFDPATGNCGYRMDVGFPHAHLVNIIELIKTQCIQQQLSAVAVQQQQQERNRILRPGDRFRGPPLVN